MPAHKQHNESVQLITYLCHQCKQQTFNLSSMSRCSHCNSEFVEELNTSDNNTNTNSVTTSVNTNTNIETTKITPKLENKTSPQKTSESLGEKSAEMCSICLEVVTEVSSKRLSCKHNFHTVCIDPWLKTNITCPMCRKTVIKRSPHAMLSAIAALSADVRREHAIHYRLNRAMRPVLVPMMNISRPVSPIRHRISRPVVRLSRAEMLSTNHQRVLRSRSSRR